MKIIRNNLVFNVRENTLDEWIVDEVLNYNCYAKHLNIKSNDVVLDIGMNIGAFTVLASSLGAKVIGYEPEKENFDLAVSNIMDNKSNAEVFNFGVSDVEKTKILYLNDKKNRADHTSVFVKGRRPIEIKCKNINDILKEYKPNKIKIDCEGDEYEIIMAVADWYNTEKLVFEWHRRTLKDINNVKFDEILAKLDKDFAVIGKRDSTAWTQNIKCSRL